MNKILIFTDTWSPKIDGVVTSIINLKTILESRGFEVVIIHPYLFFNVSLFFYPEFKFSLFIRKKILKIIKSEKPNYVHIATEGPLGYVARKICIKNKISFTTTYHTHLPLYTKKRVNFSQHLTYSYLRWFHKKANKTFVCTQSLKDELELHGFNNLEIVSLGVDSNFFKKNIQLNVGGLKSPVFAYLGRIAIEKNVEDFLKLKLSGTKLVIGDGPERLKLESKYGNEALFVGYKKGQELVDCLSLCDVFVFPSVTETFGLVILEALACGLPVAAYNVMGPKDIVTNGVDGYLGDDLGASAIKCLNLSSDKCREKALQFTWEAYVDNFIKNNIRIR